MFWGGEYIFVPGEIITGADEENRDSGSGSDERYWGM